MPPPRYRPHLRGMVGSFASIKIKKGFGTPEFLRTTTIIFVVVQKQVEQPPPQHQNLFVAWWGMEQKQLRIIVMIKLYSGFRIAFFWTHPSIIFHQNNFSLLNSFIPPSFPSSPQDRILILLLIIESLPWEYWTLPSAA